MMVVQKPSLNKSGVGPFLNGHPSHFVFLSIDFKNYFEDSTVLSMCCTCKLNVLQRQRHNRVKINDK